MKRTPRATSQPAFWDARYQLEGYAFGEQPDPFVAARLSFLEGAGAISVPARFADLGAGEGRVAVHAAERGHHVTAVDFAGAGLAMARSLATKRSVCIDVAEENLTTWLPREPLDVAILLLVHLLPEARGRVLANMPALLRPGGWLIARWFHEAHAARGTFGPSKRDRLVTAQAIRDALPGGTLHQCARRSVLMASGRYLHGEADVLDVVWQALAP